MLTFKSFPKIDPSDNGLNNASILTFEDDKINALIKEMTQNSLDALAEGEKKLKIKITQITLSKNDIPNWEALDKIFDNLIEYWGKQRQIAFSNYFREAQRKLNANEIIVFAFEDFKTTGLNGNMSQGSFRRLLLDEGVQGDKPVDGSLGGFGIGKNAIFALTPMQTVFYTSFNSEGIKFMGVSKLAEYLDESNIKRSNRIYYGNWISETPNTPNDLKYISEYSEIPTPFRRNEFGLSTFAIGINSSNKWTTPVIRSLITNYWYRFLNDGIEVEIIDFDGSKKIINKENLDIESINMFTELTHQDEAFDKSILAYIKAFKEPQVDGIYSKIINIHEFGEIKIHLIEQQEDESIEFPNKVVYIRDGMMIKEDSLGVGNLQKKIAGVIFCESVKGNKILSQMEPPAHDNFSPERLNRLGGELKESDGRNILKEINKAKKEAIKKLQEKYTISSRSSALVDEIFSGFTDSTALGTSDGISSISKKEEFYKRKKQKDDSIEKKTPEDLFIISEGKINNTSELGDNGGSGGGKPGPGTREGNGGVGPKQGIGNGGIGNLGGDNEKKKSMKRKDAEISVTFFFDRREDNRNIYFLVVRTSKDLENTHLSFSQIGDDGGNSRPTSKIHEITDLMGNKYDFTLNKNEYTIHNINLKSNEQNIFNCSLIETHKSAFKFLNK
jgi:hypothetical protein